MFKPYSFKALKNWSAFFFLGLVFLQLIHGSQALGQNEQPKVRYDDAFWENINTLSTGDPKKAIKTLAPLFSQFEKDKDYPNLTLTHAYNALSLAWSEGKDSVGKATEAIAISKRYNQSKSHVLALLALNRSHSSTLNYKAALQATNNALILSEKINDLFLQAESTKYTASIYYYLKDYETALTKLLKAMEIYEKMNRQRELGFTLNSIANVYFSLGKNEQSILFTKQALEKLNLKTDARNIAVTSYNLAIRYMEAKELEKALKTYEKVINISESINYTELEARANEAIGDIYSIQKKYKEAEDKFKTSLSLSHSKSNQRNVYFTMIKLFLKTNRPDKAIAHLAKIKNILTVDGVFRPNSAYHFYLSSAYEQKGDTKKALGEYKLYSKISKKSIENSGAKSLQTMTVKFSLDQAKKDNEILRAKEQLSEIKLIDAQKTKKMMSIIIGLSLLLVIGIALGLYRYYRSSKKYKTLALRDELTGVPNRRAIFQMANNLYQESKDEGGDFSLAIADIDLFKDINDTYGHDVGDEVLKDFAKALTAALRDNDYLGRIGGEEWLILLPNANKGKIPEIFARLQKASMDLAIEGIPTDKKVTFSMGVVNFKDANSSLDDMIKLADNRLYEAKENGRNQFAA